MKCSERNISQCILALRKLSNTEAELKKNVTYIKKRKLAWKDGV